MMMMIIQPKIIEQKQRRLTTSTRRSLDASPLTTAQGKARQVQGIAHRISSERHEEESHPANTQIRFTKFGFLRVDLCCIDIKNKKKRIRKQGVKCSESNVVKNKTS
jgi:hypothetical protein